MKILYCSTVGVFLNAFIIPYAKYFQSRGWRVDALANGIRSSKSCRDTFNNVYEASWCRNPFDLPTNLTSIRQIQRLVIENQYDIIHVHTPVAGFIIRFALRKTRLIKKTKVVYTAHGFHFHPQGGVIRNVFFLMLERLAGNWCDALVTINQTDYDSAIRYKVIDSSRLFLFPGIGVDTNLLERSKINNDDILELKDQIGITKFSHSFLMIAEFNPGKRHKDILLALNHMQRPDLCVVFAGEGVLLDSTRQFAADLGLTDRCYFLGQRHDIPLLISMADAVLLPSEREGLPRCLMEALCLETPFIGSNIRGIRDLADGGCGLLHKVGEISEISQLMQWMCLNPTKRTLMGSVGCLKMKSYDLIRVIKLHEKMYFEMYKEIV